MKITLRQVTDTYCSPEVSIMLKGKGLKGKCCAYQTQENNSFIDHLYNSQDFAIAPHLLAAPTHQMAIEWIRENFGIWIETRQHSNQFQSTVIDFGSFYPTEKYRSNTFFLPQDAINAALVYTLKNILS